MEYITLTKKKPDKQVIARTVAVLKTGGVIVYPTDTLYGLGVEAFDQNALTKLFLLKQRANKAPVSLMVDSIAKIEKLNGEIEEKLKKVLKELLPGKFTVILKNNLNDGIPHFYDPSNLAKVGFRIPDHPFCLELSKALKRPITSTSANRTGEKDITSVVDSVAQFGNKLDLIINAGELETTKGSTVIDFTKQPFLVLREGETTADDLNDRFPDHEFRLKRDKFTITFVCSGNICRSPMARAILDAKFQKTRYKDLVNITSGGTLGLKGHPAHHNTLEVAQENNIDLWSHQSQPVDTGLMKKSDIVFCLAYNHYRRLIELYPQYENKIVLIREWNRETALNNPSIADPIGHDLDYFRENFYEIFSEIKRIFPFLLSEVRRFIEYNDLDITG